MSKHTKEEMINILVTLSEKLTKHTSAFPALVGVVVAMNEAAEDLTAKAVKKEPKPQKVKPVTIDYEGEQLLVKGVPWGQVGLALKRLFNQIAGVPTKTIDPATGEPFFRSCFDRKAKGFRLPKDKDAEVRACIKDAGLVVASAG